MDNKRFFLVSGIIFAAIAVVHFARLLAGWPFIIGSFAAPNWISAGGIVLFGLMSVWAFRLRSA